MSKILDDWNKIKERVINSKLSEWKAYHFNNDFQDLDRLSLNFLEYEIQLNRIRHANGAHCHTCNMVSQILLNGYRWYLSQKGASHELYFYSGQGSLITMGPEDGHRILPCELPSISLCVFDKQGEIHTHYKEWKKLSEKESSYILSTAISELTKV